ncbi:uncharacterized protein LOC108744000 isoform X2 [Agrilus planipennis]|uniref:Uncharacterized protein LOC108744000 isoform X2 n=1 Tax=Agrilus planipennis TaxID=224129 RepID=A0A1W4XGI2_AGRPL|nr:uncharacterized protein LOC108744000 isoform X2 [Agrilus planipennis]
MADLRERHISRENVYGQKFGKNYFTNQNSSLREEQKVYVRQLNGPMTRRQSSSLDSAPSLQELNGHAYNTYKNQAQESTYPTTTDTEQAVSKISAMFPTVSDTHIRILLKKYHNREALVISALQVEKHPITTPGPYATPPPGRNINVHPSIHAARQITPPLSLHSSSRTGSPILRPGSDLSSGYISEYRSSPKTPHSPKMKLRYMKSIFPKADEDVILDILCNNDNNIQKTSGILEDMGFQRREIVKIIPKQPQKKNDGKKDVCNENIIPSTKLKTLVDKAQMTFRLREKYPHTPEHLITFALESVDFEEEKAHQILSMMIEEEKSKEAAAAKERQEENSGKAEVMPISLSESRQSLKSLMINEQKEGSMKQSSSFCRVLEETGEYEGGYISSNLQNTMGANPNNVKGANSQLLLKSYVHCHGADPKLRQIPSKGLAKGPNSKLVSLKNYQAHGPNPELRKGPKIGLAKGNIFSQLKNIVVGESRGRKHFLNDGLILARQ